MMPRRRNDCAPNLCFCLCCYVAAILVGLAPVPLFLYRAFPRVLSGSAQSPVALCGAAHLEAAQSAGFRRSLRALEQVQLLRDAQLVSSHDLCLAWAVLVCGALPERGRAAHAGICAAAASGAKGRAPAAEPVGAAPPPAHDLFDEFERAARANVASTAAVVMALGADADAEVSRDEFARGRAQAWWGTKLFRLENGSSCTLSPRSGARALA